MSKKYYKNEDKYGREYWEEVEEENDNIAAVLGILYFIFTVIVAISVIVGVVKLCSFLK